MEHAPLQMAQTNTFELEAVDESTKVTWTVDWELTGGFSLTKLLLRFSAGGAFEEMIAGSLENLKMLVEKEVAATAEEGAKPDEAVQKEGEEPEPEESPQEDLDGSEPRAVAEKAEDEAEFQEAEKPEQSEKSQ